MEASATPGPAHRTYVCVRPIECRGEFKSTKMLGSPRIMCTCGLHVHATVRVCCQGRRDANHKIQQMHNPVQLKLSRRWTIQNSQT